MFENVALLIAAVMAEHAVGDVEGDQFCRCGHRFATATGHRAHVANEAAGFIVAALEPPDNARSTEP